MILDIGIVNQEDKKAMIEVGSALMNKLDEFF